MTNPEKISDFLRKANNAYCDDCLGHFLEINRHEVHTITSSFGLTTEFTKTSAICPGQCSTREKFVTRYNSKPQSFISAGRPDDTKWRRGETL
jgi:hypothetical protein